MNIKKSAIMLMLLFSAVPCLSSAADDIIVKPQTDPAVQQDHRWRPRPEICRWYNGAEGAVSLTFDDGTLDHFEKGMELWARHGWKVTLGIVSTTIVKRPDWRSKLQDAFDQGHEIANHTKTHPNLSESSEEMVRDEIGSCHQFLLDNVQGLEAVDTLIYPYEAFHYGNFHTAAEFGYIFARSGPQEREDIAQRNASANPPWMHLHSWANQDILPMWMWDSTTDLAVSKQGWMIEQCHGIGEAGEPGVGWSPRPLADFEEHYRYLASFGERVWVAPIREVGRYLLESRQFTIEATDFDSDYMIAAISRNADYQPYWDEISVQVEIPEDWTDAEVLADGQILSAFRRSGKLLIANLPAGTSELIVRRARP
jgi:peptidoglycan/xylan/chitin deacetylase (PgdA/CDA1 family)